MGTGNDNDRYVVEHDDGWAVVKEEHERASAVFPTQAEAIDRAREIIRNAGGGELVVRGRDGKIRQKDTVAAGPRTTVGEPAEPTAASALAEPTAASAPVEPTAASAAAEPTAASAPAEPTPAAAPQAPAPSAAPMSSAAAEGRFASMVRKLRGH